jgi:hypothetical protein
MEVKVCPVHQRNGIPLISIADDFITDELGWEIGSLVHVVAKGDTLVLHQVSDNRVDYKHEFQRVISRLNPDKDYL